MGTKYQFLLATAAAFPNVDKLAVSTQNYFQ